MAKLRTNETIYLVEIIACNQGAWYKDNIGKQYKTTEDHVVRPFKSDLPVFKVLGSFNPVKYILKEHCKVINQHEATHKELMQKHEGN